MKKLFTIISLFVVMTAQAQTVKRGAQGNYHVAQRDSVHADKPEGHTIIDKDGKTHPIYISSRGKLYWLKTSKAGNVYKAYIKR